MGTKGLKYFYLFFLYWLSLKRDYVTENLRHKNAKISGATGIV